MANTPPRREAVQIRRAILKDAEAISTIVARCVKAFPAGIYNDVQLNKFVHYYSAAKLHKRMAAYPFFCAETQGQLLGSIGLAGNEVIGLYVDPAARGLGVGYELVRYLEDFAREQGLAELTLTATTTAEDFYLRQGFTGDTYEDVNVEGVIFPERRMYKKL